MLTADFQHIHTVPGKQHGFNLQDADIQEKNLNLFLFFNLTKAKMLFQTYSHGKIFGFLGYL